MPTMVSRAQSILDAAINTTSTAAQQTRVAQALAFQAGMDYASMTANDKAVLLVSTVRAYIVSAVKQMDAASAAKTAVTNSNTAVDTEFVEAP